MSSEILQSVQSVVELLQEADGELTGRTRLHKTVCLLELAGEDLGFSFSYRHYGPYSENLASAVSFARDLGLIEEEEVSTRWGG